MSINCLACHGLVLLDYPVTGSGKWGQLEVSPKGSSFENQKDWYFLKVGCIVTMNIEGNDLLILKKERR